MRPPYGDTDNRVRAVARAVGLKSMLKIFEYIYHIPSKVSFQILTYFFIIFVAVLWVPEFDSNDWTLTSNPPKSVDFVINTFETWMQTFPKLKTGFIVLEHDLYPQTVDAAVQIIDRAVKVPNLKIMTVPQCIGDNNPYLEVVGNNSTTNGATNSATNGATTAGKSLPSSVSASSSSIIIPFTVGSIITVLFSSLLNLN